MCRHRKCSRLPSHDVITFQQSAVVALITFSFLTHVNSIKKQLLTMNKKLEEIVKLITTYRNQNPRAFFLGLMLLIAILACVIVLASGLSSPEVATQEPQLPQYAKLATWKTVVVNTGNTTSLDTPAVAFQLPELPKELPAGQGGLRRYMYANEQCITICAVLPVETPLITSMGNPAQTAGNPVEEALQKDKIDIVRNTFAELISKEIATSSFADKKLALDTPLTFTPCIYKKHPASFFAGTVVAGKDAPQSLTVSGRLFVFNKAVVYLYCITASDLGANLASFTLESIRFAPEH